MSTKIDKEFVWSARNGSENKIGSCLYNEDGKSEDKSELLVLMANPPYPIIIGITKQLKITGELDVMKNPIVIQIFNNLVQKSDEKLKIEPGWDNYWEFEQNTKTNGQMIHRD